MSKKNFHCSHSNQAPSADGAETNEKHDDPAKLLSDSCNLKHWRAVVWPVSSEYSDSDVKQQRGHNWTKKRKQ